MLPEIGIMAEESAVAFVYIDQFAGVAFPHWLMTRPGLDQKEARRVTSIVLDSLSDEARGAGAHTMITTVHQPGLHREAVGSFGWQWIGTGATLYKEVV